MGQGGGKPEKSTASVLIPPLWFFLIRYALSAVMIPKIARLEKIADKPWAWLEKSFLLSIRSA
jgi:hypothetical protein